MFNIFLAFSVFANSGVWVADRGLNEPIRPNVRAKFAQAGSGVMFSSMARFPNWVFPAFIVLLCALAGGTFAAEVAPKPLVHGWRNIYYAPLKAVPPAPAHALLHLSAQREAPEMTFNITCGSEGLAKPGVMTVRLHRGSEPPLTVESPGPSAIGMGSGVSQIYGFSFPWSSNVLAEAWIELKFPGQTYWLEIPYGFTRNPADPPVASPGLEFPRLAPAMKNLGPNDHLLPWLHVQYDPIEIQNGWRLGVRQENRFYPETEVTLYQGDGSGGKGYLTWEMFSPRTSVKVVGSDGRGSGSICLNIRRHENGSRSDTFKLFGDEAKGRDWGRLLVTVDGQTHELLMPSSMFRRLHGVAEWEHPRRRWPERP
jgi:hypothetical protein